MSQKLTILAQFEFCWKIKNPQNGTKYTHFLYFLSILSDFEDFLFFSKIQIELKSTLSDKNDRDFASFFFLNDKKKLDVRSLPRVRTSTLREIVKKASFWYVGKIFNECARAKNFLRRQKVQWIP